MDNTQRKILIVDDDQAIREIMQVILENAKFQVITACQYKEVQQATDKNKLGLILLDIQLGGESGVEITQKLKDDPGTHSIPIILISASMKVDELTSEAGADGYLLKPFDVADLISVAEKYIQKGGEK